MLCYKTQCDKQKVKDVSEFPINSYSDFIVCRVIKNMSTEKKNECGIFWFGVLRIANAVWRIRRARIDHWLIQNVENFSTQSKSREKNGNGCESIYSYSRHKIGYDFTCQLLSIRFFAHCVIRYTHCNVGHGKILLRSLFPDEKLIGIWQAGRRRLAIDSIFYEFLLDKGRIFLQFTWAEPTTRHKKCLIIHYKLGEKISQSKIRFRNTRAHTGD